MATQILLDLPTTIITSSGSSGGRSGSSFSNSEALGTYISITNVLGMLTAGVIGKFARLIVATAGTGQTLNYVHIYGN